MDLDFVSFLSLRVSTVRTIELHFLFGWHRHSDCEGWWAFHSITATKCIIFPWLTKTYKLNKCVNVQHVDREEWRLWAVFNFFPPRSNSCISFCFFTQRHSVFIIDLSYCTFLSCHVRRKKYIPVRKCQEAAAIVGTALRKPVRNAPSLCLPLVLSAELFLSSLFPVYSQQILFLLSRKCLPRTAT